MVLRADTLVAGSTYTFSLSATYLSIGERRLQDSSTGEALAEITFLVNSPPTSGLISVAPTEGVLYIFLPVFNTFSVMP